MSFWSLSDNTQAESATTYEVSNSKPIPNNTNLKGMIEKAEWKFYNGENYVNLTWTILEGKYTNRKVFQKVRIENTEPDKRDKAIRMLAAIDANCGGFLMKKGVCPSEADLSMQLRNKPMIIKVMVWEMDDGRSGNWICKVAPLDSVSNATAPDNSVAKVDLNEELDF